MFGRSGWTPQPSWKPVDDDFVLGACSRRLFGYISRASEGTWQAFDDGAEPVGGALDLNDAKAALWMSHRDAHRVDCAHPSGSWWQRPARARSGKHPSSPVSSVEQV